MTKITPAGMTKQPAGRQIIRLVASEAGKIAVAYERTTAGSAAERMLNKQSVGYKWTWRVMWA